MKVIIIFTSASAWNVEKNESLTTQISVYYQYITCLFLSYWNDTSGSSIKTWKLRWKPRALTKVL